VEQAKRVAALSHPAIGLAQVGLHGNTPFFATEHFVGETLTEWLAGSPSMGERLRLVETLADALNHVHERGVVHGGLEPSAVRITDDGECKLADFALSSAADRGSAITAAYTPPEVVQGGAYSQKSEIHAAGLLFYEILAGKNPFLRGNTSGSRDAVLSVQPQPLFEARREVPRDLSDAIMACLEKDPDWRPKDLTYILELAGPASAKAKGGKPARAATGRTGPVAKAPSFGSVANRSRSSSRMPLFAAVAVGLGALGAGAWYWMRPTAPAPPGPKVASVVPSQAGQPREAPPETTPGPAVATPDPRTPATTLPSKSKLKDVDREATPEPPTLAPAAPPSTMPAPTPRPVSSLPTPEPELRPTPQEPEPVRPPPTSVAAAPVSLPAEPALLKNLTPPTVKRGGTSILDVHGSGLRPDHQTMILKGKDVARGIQLTRQRLVNGGLIQVVILVDAAATPGTYALILTDNQGNATNALRFEVAH
jgi:serine/threonine-protein kinase